MNNCNHERTFKAGKRIYADAIYQMHKCKICSKLLKGDKLIDNPYKR